MHAAATTPTDRERHAIFLAHMLLLAFAALAIAPLFLAFHGVPTPAESLLFALSLAPAAAAILVARTGRLTLGHLVVSMGYAGAALVLFLGLHVGPGAAIAWLAAAWLEALAARDRRLFSVAAWGIGAAIGAIVALSFDAGFAPTGSPASAASLAGLGALASALAARRIASGAPHDDVGRGEEWNVEAAPDALVVDLDSAGTVLSLSASPNGSLAAPEHMTLGRGLLERVLVTDRPVFLQLVDEAAHSPRSVAGRFRLRVFDGESDRTGVPTPSRYQPVEMCARRVTGSEPATAMVVAVLTDATADDSRERELADARRTIEELLLARERMTTTMNHELRAPLNAIIGFSETLASRTTRPADVAKQCELARVINESGRHLLTFVDDFLVESRVETGTFQSDAHDAAPTSPQERRFPPTSIKDAA